MRPSPPGEGGLKGRMRGDAATRSECRDTVPHPSDCVAHPLPEVEGLNDPITDYFGSSLNLTSILPEFLPEKSPMNASGAFSIPS